MWILALTVSMLASCIIPKPVIIIRMIVQNEEVCHKWERIYLAQPRPVDRWWETDPIFDTTKVEAAMCIEEIE